MNKKIIRVCVKHEGFYCVAYDQGNAYIWDGNPTLSKSQPVAVTKVPVITDIERLSELRSSAMGNLVDYVHKFGGYVKSYENGESNETT